MGKLRSEHTTHYTFAGPSKTAVEVQTSPGSKMVKGETTERKELAGIPAKKIRCSCFPTLI